MTLALARKYRPRRFSTVAVQSHVSNTLRGAIARNRVAHGYLLCGPRGTGKTTLARVLAMALNCERRHDPAHADDGEPCGECDSCRRIWSGSASLDVVEIDAASNRGVDDARELRERAMYAPSGEQRYKVYIVDEAHMLTREAWNALLKVLEEPPPRVVFVFATTEPQKIAQTAAPVLSRLQRFDLKRIGPAEIRERLAEVLDAEGVPAEPEALAMIARAADGGLRDALSLTDQVLSLGAGAEVTADGVREALGLVAEDEYLTVLDLIAEHRAGDIFGAVSRLVDAGVDLGAFLTGLADILRAQLAVTLGAPALEHSERLVEALRARRERLAAGDLLRMLHMLAELEPRFRRSAQQQLLLETLLVRFAMMDRSLAIEAVLRELGGDEGDAGDGATRSRAPRPDAGGGAAGGGGGPRSQRGGSVGGGSGGSRSSASPSELRGAGGPSAIQLAPPPSLRAPSGRPPKESGDAPRSATTAPARTPLELNRLVERWDEVPTLLRESGRPVLAPVVADAVPCAVTASGVVTLQADDESAAYTLESGRDAIEAALRQLFDGVQRVAVRRTFVESAPSAAPQRLTLEQVRADRMARMRARDPALDAAVEALDLELID